MKTPLTKKQMEKKRRAAQERVFEIVNVLHDAKFSSLLIESTQIGLDDYYTRIVIDREELGGDDMKVLFTFCEEHDCLLSLRNDYKHGSRIALWVTHGA